MAMSCNNERVVITAEAAGIGRAIAEAFADAGACMFVYDVDAQALEAFAARI